MGCGGASRVDLVGRRRHRDDLRVGVGHGPPVLLLGRGRAGGPCDAHGGAVVTVETDADRVEERLSSGRLACPGCSGAGGMGSGPGSVGPRPAKSGVDRSAAVEVHRLRGDPRVAPGPGASPSTSPAATAHRQHPHPIRHTPFSRKQSPRLKRDTRLTTSVASHCLKRPGFHAVFLLAASPGGGPAG